MLLADLHNDAAMKLISHGVSLRKSRGLLHVDFDKIRVARPDLLCFACYCDPCFTGPDAFEIAKAQVEVLKRDFAAADSPVKLALSASDIDRIRSTGRGKGKTAAIMSVEGGYPIVDDLRTLDDLYALGIRLITLTHVKATPWAGSDGEEPKKGLTPFGEQVVRRMNELGMIVDVAHTSTATMLAACRVSSQPVIYSHGGVYGLVPSSRSISDKAIDAIAKSGGVVGLSFFPPHLIYAPPKKGGMGTPSLLEEMEKLAKPVLSDSSLSVIEKFGKLSRIFDQVTETPAQIPDLEALFANIDYLIRRVGEDFVALGGDYDGIPFACAGIEDLSKIRSIVPFLEKKGYSGGRIEKIMGGNALRVVRQVLG